ncbi:MAG: AMP-binding protein [Parasphingorhabdus sp.]|uniref:AMP-binding protein n=1 Tax=Parasphingorhabdus sp. TaxID=2709688 RepID=UPI0030019974
MMDTRASRENRNIDEVVRRHLITGAQDIVELEERDPVDMFAGQTIFKSLAAAAAIDIEKPAMVLLDLSLETTKKQVLSYEVYLRKVSQAANIFRSLNGGEPPVVAAMLPIIPEGFIAAWGAVTAGIFMPVNPHLEPAMVAALLTASGANILVTTTAHGPSAADRLNEILAVAPGVHSVLLVDSDNIDMDFSRHLEAMDGNLAFTPDQDPLATCTYLPTGGTTGQPKLAKLTQQGMLINAWIGGAIMGPDADEVIGIGMPSFHVGGLIMLALRSLLYGQKALLLTAAGFRNRDVVENFWDIVQSEAMTSLIATPTTAAMILNGKMAPTDHGLRTFTCGGSTIPLELGTAFPATFGVELREVWGATEFHGFQGCQPNVVKPRIGSVGLPSPWHRAKAVEVDENNIFVREVERGKQGVIAINGPCVCDGYLDSSQDAGFIISGMPNDEKWGSSGDLGRIDEDGFIWIDGRAKDVIIRGGHNIEPKVIEEALSSHPDIVLVAAIGRPDKVKGELPVAYVQVRHGSSISAAELLAYCRDSVPERAACPVAIELIDKMPLTAVGKIFKPALRDDVICRMANEILTDRLAGISNFSVSVPESAGRKQLLISLEIESSSLNADIMELFSGFDFNTRIKVKESQVS